MNSNKPILIVEDDQIDAQTIKRALKENHVSNKIIHVENGVDALDYLQNNKEMNPCIILLDLNMPKMNGLEFLRIIKQDDVFKRIPVVVLTTSKDEQGKMESFELGISGYMLKPVDYHQFVEVIRTINLYWTLSQIPD